MRSLVQDIRFAARALLKRPGFTVVAILTLALGIGANTAVFSVVNAIVLNGLPFRDADRLVTLGDNFISTAEQLYMQEHMRQFEDVASYSPGWGMALTSDGEPTQLTAARASINLLPLLGISPLLGRAFTTDEATPGRDRVVLLSHAFWRQRFGGEPDVVGRSITLDGSPYTVVGVLPADFEIASGSIAHFLVPAVVDPAAWFHRGQNALGIARLAPGATAETALTELRGHLPAIRAAFSYVADYGQNFNVIGLYEYLIGPVRTMLLVILGAVGFIVLIASANVGNLLLVRATERQRDVAVRVALGASRSRIVRGVAVESLLLALGGTLLGLLLAWSGVGVIRGMLPANMPRVSSIGLDERVLAVCAAVGAIVGLVALIPALTSTRTSPSDALRATRGDASGRLGLRWRGALVSTEIALALVLVVGAGLMVKTLWRLSQVDPGFQADRVLTFRLQQTGSRTAVQRIQYFDRVLEEVAAIPGVERVGAIHHLPMSGYNWWADVDVDGRPLAAGEAPPRAGWRIIVGDYLRTMAIPLLSGRAFAATDNSETERVVLVNDVFARSVFPNEDPVGRRIRAGNATRGEWARIIGITGSVRHQALEQMPAAEMYFPITQVGMGFVNVVARTTLDPVAVAEPARRIVQAIDPTVALSDMRALGSVVRQSTGRQRLVLQLLATFAGVGLLLAAIGVYGVVAFGVTQRRHEIGIRAALGARRQSIVAMVLQNGLRHTAIGLAVGIPAAFALTRTMQTVVYDLSTFDPLTYVAVTLILLLAALLASWIPARRAAALDPVQVLKGD